jgi:hypothetical protein
MDKKLATVNTEDGPYGWAALKELAKKPFAIACESRTAFSKSRLNSCLFASIPDFFICRDIYIYTHDISQVVLLLHYSQLHDLDIGKCSYLISSNL